MKQELKKFDEEWHHLLLRIFCKTTPFLTKKMFSYLTKRQLNKLVLL